MKAKLLKICVNARDFPDESVPELAVAGRSNCGKSSLINALTGHTRLARTSSTPGRTRQIFFYSVQLRGAPPFIFVDLPGYGFAKVSKKERAGWGQLIDGYLQNRPQLRGLLLLQDIRRRPGEEEHGLQEWMSELQLPSLVLLTKADKLSKNKRFAVLERFKKDLGLPRRPMPVSVREPATVASLQQQIALLINNSKE